jgi:hypothetical protein
LKGVFTVGSGSVLNVVVGGAGETIGDGGGGGGGSFVYTSPNAAGLLIAAAGGGGAMGSFPGGAGSPGTAASAGGGSVGGAAGVGGSGGQAADGGLGTGGGGGGLLTDGTSVMSGGFGGKALVHGAAGGAPCNSGQSGGGFGGGGGGCLDGAGGGGGYNGGGGSGPDGGGGGGGSFSAVSATPGDPNAGPGEVTISYTAPEQTITWAQQGPYTYGQPPVALTATASSGLPVSYTMVSGPCSVSGSTLTINGAGACVVQADQAGGDGFLAAQPVQQTITINRAPTQLTVSKASYGLLTITFSARLTSQVTGARIPGQPVVFSVAGVRQCQGTTDVNGVASCTKSGLVIVLGAIPYTATYAGNANYVGSTGTGRL